MRDWEPPEKADVIISELLGSFGDNELSPECLRHAKDFLKEDGVCIPQNSVSYLAPLCSPSLHANGKIAGKEIQWTVSLHSFVWGDRSPILADMALPPPMDSLQSIASQGGGG